MSDFHTRVLAAQRAQLEARRAVLDAGATHIGWKVGLDIPGAEELVGDAPTFGYLTSASLFQSGTVFAAEGIRELQVDCELAVTLGHDLLASGDRDDVTHSIGGLATGLELCDVGRPPDDFDSIVAANIFHRAFALGPSRPPPPSSETSFDGRVWVNDKLQHKATSAAVLDRILGVARLLEAVGECLRAGDRVICGAICGGPLAVGDEVEVEVGDLGRLRVTIGR
jgi:2-keto-4-pentenoate hydratase